MPARDKGGLRKDSRDRIWMKGQNTAVFSLSSSLGRDRAN